MKQLAKNRMLAALAVCLLLGRAHAAPLGTAFTYQGSLSGSGLPSTGAFDFEFSLFDAAGGGNQVGSTLTDPSVPVNNGIFAVTLDFNNVFNGQARWLAIGVRPSGSTGVFTALTLLQWLSPTPYALYATNAGSGIGVGGSVSVAQLSTTGPAPALGQVLAYNGSTLVWTNPSSGGGGGENNTAKGLTATVGGGTGNAAAGNYGAIAGGQNNLASGEWAAVAGGWGNSAGGISSFIGGGGASFSANVGNTNGGDFSTIGGGMGNSISAPPLFFTMAGVTGAFIGGGSFNTNGASNSVIAGGYSNLVLVGTDVATIGGGQGNSVTAGSYGTVAGGWSNNAGVDGASVGGGEMNKASGWNSTVPGGSNNVASGAGSFAAGAVANCLYDNSFVWGDGTRGAFDAGPDTFNVLATGGIYLFPNTAGTDVVLDTNADLDFGTTTRQMLNLYGNAYGIGVQTDDMYFLTAPSGEFWWFMGGVHSNDFGDAGGGKMLMRLGNTGNLIIAGALTQNSDQTANIVFSAVNSETVLKKVAALPILQWAYKAEPPNTRHVGPMAQDFYAAFGLGEDDKHITTIDEDGVALAAIQGLNQKLEADAKTRDAEIAELKGQIAELKEIVGKLAKPARGMTFNNGTATR